jgi:hypothetical protein
MRSLKGVFLLAAVMLIAVPAWASDGQSSGQVRSLGHAKIPYLTPQEGACVEVDVELIEGQPNENIYTLSTELLNCGDEAAHITVEVSLDLNGIVVGPFTHYVHIAAGESLVRSIAFSTHIPIPAGNYTLCIKASAGESSDEDCATLSVAGATAGKPVVENYPNPFNAQTRIGYQVTQAGPVKIEVFNLLGRSVVKLVDADAAPGVYSVVWDGHDSRGQEVSSGTYFYRLTLGDQVVTRQMTLLK